MRTLIRFILFCYYFLRNRLDTRHFCPGCLSRRHTTKAVAGEVDRKTFVMPVVKITNYVGLGISGPSPTTGEITIMENTCKQCGGIWYTEPAVHTDNFSPCAKAKA